MTRRDYVAIAAALREDAAHLDSATAVRDYSAMTEWSRGAYDQWHTTVGAVADVLAADNPRFDRGRFYTACGREDGAS